MMSSKPFVVLLVLVAVVGVAVSLASWCFLELIHQIQQEVFVHLPHAFGYSNEPRWWPLPVLPIAALITAFAIEKLPGRGGHIPANGLATGGAASDHRRSVQRSAGCVCHDRAGLGARPGGATDRAGLRARRVLHPPGPQGGPAPGRHAGGRGRQLRGRVVRVQLAADRRGDPDRGLRDRRGQAPAPARARAACGRHRLVGVAGHGLVYRAEHQRLCARRAAAARRSGSPTWATSRGRSGSRSRSPPERTSSCAAARGPTAWCRQSRSYCFRSSAWR